MLRLGLIGYPLQQSLSPRLHSAALQAIGLPGEYRLYPVPPLPSGQAELARLAERVRRGELDGLNVTIPHKQAVMPRLDDLTPRAGAIGAVNTIFRQDGRAIGDNTDAPGFLADLHSLLGADFPMQRAGTPLSSPGAALVLGAGGAARAVVYALGQSGWQVFVAARRFEQAQQLVSSFQRFPDSPSIQNLVALPLDPASLANLKSEIANQKSKILVNATSAGMIPDVETSPWPEDFPFPEGAFVYDLVYKPPETALMRSARQAGLSAANGLGMLVEQAALSLERWTGRSIPRQAMRNVVNERLAGGDPSSSITPSPEENR